jgi:hypothetical protein
MWETLISDNSDDKGQSNEEMIDKLETFYKEIVEK